MKALSKAPTIHPAETAEPGVRAFFYDSVPYRGKPTRVFAYYGAPAVPKGRKVPAMVLVHGGAGSAYAEWVRLWNRRGYAAIAFDHFGQISNKAPLEAPYSTPPAQNPDGGPAGGGAFAQIDLPAKDAWEYHAVSAAVLANSLLRSFPEVDANKIGITGVSWGGYLTSIIAGVDSRFRFAVPVYGCGFLAEDSYWAAELDRMGPERKMKWVKQWDPSNYLPKARMPMLWLNGTNDFAFFMSSWQKSALLTKGPRTLSLHVRMPHGQHEGAVPEEIAAFADAILKGGVPLATVKGAPQLTGKVASVAFTATDAIYEAELVYTKDSGPWPDRRWDNVPAIVSTVRPRKGTVEATVPAGAKAFFFNLIDKRGLITSSQYRTVE